MRAIELLLAVKTCPDCVGALCAVHAPLADALDAAAASPDVQAARAGLASLRETGGSIPVSQRKRFASALEEGGDFDAEPPVLNKSGGSQGRRWAVTNRNEVSWEESGDTIAPCCFLFPLETPPGGTWTCPECGASWWRDQDQPEAMGTVRRVNKSGGSDVEGEQ